MFKIIIPFRFDAFTCVWLSCCVPEEEAVTQAEESVLSPLWRAAAFHLAQQQLLHVSVHGGAQVCEARTCKMSVQTICRTLGEMFSRSLALRGSLLYHACWVQSFVRLANALNVHIHIWQLIINDKWWIWCVTSSKILNGILPYCHGSLQHNEWPLCNP